MTHDIACDPWGPSICCGPLAINSVIFSFNNSASVLKNGQIVHTFLFCKILKIVLLRYWTEKISEIRNKRHRCNTNLN